MEEAMNKITKEEYEKAIEWARDRRDGFVSNYSVLANVADCLLALDGAWKEVPTGFDVHGCITAPIYSKDEIAARHGLPVDNVSQNANGETQAQKCLTDETQTLCPECKGKKYYYDPIIGRYPCPTCQGGHDPASGEQGEGR